MALYSELEVGPEITFEEALAPAPLFVTDIVEIESVQKNSDSDFLYIYKLKGYELYLQSSVVYEVGAKTVCFHVDSVLPADLEAELFPEGSKIKLSNSRIRAIKVRGFISQGLLIQPETLEKFYPGISQLPVGTDVREKLGVKKYEPPVKELPAGMKAGQAKVTHKDFAKYTDLNHFYKSPDVFKEGEEVVLTEKVHGSNARLMSTYNVTIGNLLYEKKFYGIPVTLINFRNLKKAIKKLLRIRQVDHIIGSRLVEITSKDPTWTGWYGEDIWSRVEKKYDLCNKLKPGEELFGEVYGPGVQKGYHYGLKQGELGFVAFDLMRNRQYVDFDEFERICKERDIPMVPVLYKGPFSKEALKQHTSGVSVLHPSQKIREGCVLKPAKERIDPRCGRAIQKSVCPNYLMKENTDWH